MVTGDQKNETGEVNKKVKSLNRRSLEKSTKKVKSFGAHYKDTEKSVISIVKYLDETLETLDVKKKINLEKRHFVQMAQRKTIVLLETLDVKNVS